MVPKHYKFEMFKNAQKELRSVAPLHATNLELSTYFIKELRNVLKERPSLNVKFILPDSMNKESRDRLKELERVELKYMSVSDEDFHGFYIIDSKKCYLRERPRESYVPMLVVTDILAVADYVTIFNKLWAESKETPKESTEK